MKLKQHIQRRAFTLVEMLVATALVMFIMLILSEAFVAGLEAFRTLKGIGDMEERLRAAALIIRADLERDHFESGVRLSDPTFWLQGNPPRQGFFNVTQGFTPTASLNAIPAGQQTVQVNSLTVADALNPTVGAWTIQPYMILLVDAGTAAAEYVMVLPNPPPTPATTPPTFTAAFTNPHSLGFKIRYIRQYEGNDADGLPASRATDHVLWLAVKQPGDRPENFFTAHMPYVLPLNPMAPATVYPASPTVYNPFFSTRLDGSPNPNYVPTTFGDQANDARFQDLLPTSSATIGYKTQWAEVAYFLFPNGSTAGGTPLYALYRCEYKVVPDSRYLNGQVFTLTPTAPLPPPPLISSFSQYPGLLSATPGPALVNLAATWTPGTPGIPTNDGFNEMSCQLKAITGGSYAPNTFFYSFNTPSDLAGSNLPAGTSPPFTRAFNTPVPGTFVPSRSLFSPTSPDAWSATLVATDVVSFDVQIAPGGPAGSTGGLLATSELPWSTLPNPANPAVPILASGTNDFVDIPGGSFDTATQGTGSQYSINAIRIILRVWNMKTEQTRQISIVQQL
jgi:hypothetical protein